MTVSAEFDDTDVALAAAKALTDEGVVAADDIEIRSAWPLFEEALPPHFHRPMRIRNFVRFLWVCGAIAGFSLVWFCQTDYPIRTSGQAIVPVPIDAIITYECAQITGLIMTTFFFFIETNVFRMRPIPEEEDLAVGNGQLAVVVGGPNAEKARAILERGGARAVRTFSSVAMAFLLLLSLFTTGCGKLTVGELFQQISEAPQVRMRTQTGHGVPGWPLDKDRAWPIKDQENVNAGYDPGVYSMPTRKDPDIAALTEPYGKLLEPSELDRQQLLHPSHSTPAEVIAFANPTAATVASENRGKVVYEQNCQFCHGIAGKGDGPVGEKLAIPPASIADRPDLLPPGLGSGKGSTDGDLYWTLTVGPQSHAMPAFGTKLDPMDRYYVVRYIRALQRNAGAKIPALSAQGAPKAEGEKPAAEAAPKAEAEKPAGEGGEQPAAAPEKSESPAAASSGEATK